MMDVLILQAAKTSSIKPPVLKSSEHFNVVAAQISDCKSALRVQMYHNLVEICLPFEEIFPSLALMVTYFLTAELP